MSDSELHELNELLSGDSEVYAWAESYYGSLVDQAHAVYKMQSQVRKSNGDIERSQARRFPSIYRGNYLSWISYTHDKKHGLHHRMGAAVSVNEIMIHSAYENNEYRVVIGLVYFGRSFLCGEFNQCS